MLEISGGGYVCRGCLGDSYVEVISRGEVYPRYDCSWSEYHDAWVHDNDAVECAIEGIVHDSNTVVFAQGYDVMGAHAEEHPVHGLILTEYAADCLGEKYLGNDDEEEVEEAV